MKVPFITHCLTPDGGIQNTPFAAYESWNLPVTSVVASYLIGTTPPLNYSQPTPFTVVDLNRYVTYLDGRQAGGWCLWPP